MGLAVHFLWSYGFTFGNNNIEENVMPCGCGKGLTSSVTMFGISRRLAGNRGRVEPGRKFDTCKIFFCERGCLSALSNGTWNKNLLYGLHLNG